MDIANLTKTEFIEALSKCDVRWLRTYFFGEKYRDEFSVSSLLGDSVLKNSLLVKILDEISKNKSDMELLVKELLKNHIIGKQGFVYYENNELSSARKIVSSIYKLDGYSIDKLIDTNKALSEFITDFNQRVSFLDFVVFCVAFKGEHNANTKNMISYAAGQLGSGNVCIVYDKEGSSRGSDEIVEFAQSIACPCSTLLELGAQ